MPVAIVFGASRGIGACIATTLAEEGYTLVIAAKTVDLEEGGGAQLHTARGTDSGNGSGSSCPAGTRHDTIQGVARTIEAIGGTVLALRCDVRFPEQVAAVVQRTVERFGRLDALVYNPGAIMWRKVVDTPVQRYQLMHSINALGWYAAVQAALPHMLASGSGRLLVVAPPIYSRFFKGKAPYAMTKIAASVLVMGLAPELSGTGVSVCALWPATGIQSAVTDRLQSDGALLRTPRIFADATVAALQADASATNGRCLIDEDWLRERLDVSDFSVYQVVPGKEPPRMMPRRFPSLLVEEEGAAPVFSEAVVQRHHDPRSKL